MSDSAKATLIHFDEKESELSEVWINPLHVTRLVAHSMNETLVYVTGEAEGILLNIPAGIVADIFRGRDRSAGDQSDLDRNPPPKARTIMQPSRMPDLSI